MSLHASLTPEAKATLETQKKTSTIFSVTISLLSIALLALILYVIALKVESKISPEMTSHRIPLDDLENLVDLVTDTEVTTPPSIPTSSAANVMKALTKSPLEIPTPPTNIDSLDFNMDQTLDFSDASDFEEVKSVGDLGSSERIPGTIGGYFYDFKQDRGREPVKNYEKDKSGNFLRRIKQFHRSRYHSRSLSKHFKGDKQLFIRYVAIPFSDANDGPRYFGLEKQVKPSSWMVHYNGKVTAPRDGRFRFVGVGDDYLSVGVNSKPHLMAPWHNIRKDLVTRSTNSDLDVKRPGPLGANQAERLRNHLMLGRWFSVKKGEEFDLDIALGEIPGGKMGFILMIEEKGVNYKKRKDGTPILPPFTVGELHEDDIKKLKAFPNWEFELNNVPVFQSTP